MTRRWFYQEQNLQIHISRCAVAYAWSNTNDKEKAGLSGGGGGGAIGREIRHEKTTSITLFLKYMDILIVCLSISL